MAAFMYRLAGRPSFSAPSSSPFTDLKPGDTFYKDILWLEDQGITTGYPNGKFGVNDKVTRGQMAAFLYRYAGRPGAGTGSSAFPDVKPGDNFYADILWMANQGITNGYDNGNFGPADNVTRGQMAAFLFRYVN
jgi:hypothetical protein